MENVTGSKRIKILLIMFIIATIFGWTIHQEKQIKMASWLIGTWESKTQRGIIYERWSIVSEDELSEKSYMLKEKDTIVFETVRLVEEHDSLFYIPTVKNQNNNLPVRFSLKLITDDKLIFENAKHDFPQVVSYSRIGSDSLYAEVSGLVNGKERKQSFPMRRVQ